MTRAGRHRTIWLLSGDWWGYMGGGGVDHGGYLEIHNDIHNTDFCDVIECYICYAW